MFETYKGYGISVTWSDKEMGFHYAVRRADGAEVVHSPEAYFYDENALKAAREIVDKLVQEDSEGTKEKKEDEENAENVIL